eukprot:99009-Rhodomonas_salina.3
MSRPWSSTPVADDVSACCVLEFPLHDVFEPAFWQWTVVCQSVVVKHTPVRVCGSGLTSV